MLLIENHLNFNITAFVIIKKLYCSFKYVMLSINRKIQKDLNLLLFKYLLISN